MVSINSQRINGVVTYTVIINVNNKNLLLKPGMSADVEISIQTIKDSFIGLKAALLYTPIVKKMSKILEIDTQEEITIDKKPHIWILKENKPVKIYVEILGTSTSLTAISGKQLNDKIEVITMQEISK
ncbi:hypothetical protein N9818_00850 [Arcobacteraceae bacterium]|nr:hypothetical protein [Arcobacteraceae bacterium]